MPVSKSFKMKSCYRSDDRQIDKPFSGVVTKNQIQGQGEAYALQVSLFSKKIKGPGRLSAPWT